MKRFTPLLTLLTGIGMAAVLFTMSAQAASAPGRSSSDAPAGSSPAGSAAAAPSASAPPVATAAPGLPASPEATPTAPAGDPPDDDPTARPADANWTGRLDSGATLAITAADGRAVAYVCDGKRLEIWLRGTAVDGEFALSGADGAALTGTFAGGRATGRVVVGDRRWAFTARATGKPAPVLYRAAALARDAGVDGGWILLPDGTQVGVMTWNGTPAPAPPLDPVLGTTQVDGVTISARPVAANPGEA